MKYWWAVITKRRIGKIAMGCVLNASTVIIKLFLSIHAPSPNASSMMFSRDKALNIFFQNLTLQLNTVIRTGTFLKTYGQIPRRDIYLKLAPLFYMSKRLFILHDGFSSDKEISWNLIVNRVWINKLSSSTLCLVIAWGT